MNEEIFDIFRNIGISNARERVDWDKVRNYLANGDLELEFGAEIYDGNLTGMTLLHFFCCRSGPYFDPHYNPRYIESDRENDTIVSMLLEAGADPLNKGSHQFKFTNKLATPIEVARVWKRHEIVAEIQARMLVIG